MSTPSRRWSGVVGACLQALLCAQAVVDRIERDEVDGDRVVVEWCDRTFSDLPIALFPADVTEGATVAVQLAWLEASPLPEPSSSPADPHPVDRSVDAAFDHRGKPRPESP